MANGRPFDPDRLTCATWGWPLGTVLRVSTWDGSRAVVVRVTDRGPARWTRADIDLSRAAFRRLAPLGTGRLKVRVRR
jgi:rare lipoprotein A